MSAKPAPARRRPLILSLVGGKRPTVPLLAVPLLAVLALAGCASSGPTVQDARDQLTGLSGEEILACMGPPTSIRDQGPSAVWSYTQKSLIGEAGEVGDPSTMTFQYSPFSTNQAMGGDSGGATPPPPQCTVALGFDQGKVLTVDYLGTWGGRLVRSELCGGLVAPCLH